MERYDDDNLTEKIKNLDKHIEEHRARIRDLELEKQCCYGIIEARQALKNEGILQQVENIKLKETIFGVSQIEGPLEIPPKEDLEIEG